MANENVQQTSFDEHVFLIGRPPVTEFLGFIKTLAANGQAIPQGQLMDEWRGANAHIQTLETRESGQADNPPTFAVPDNLRPLEQDILNDPLFRNAYQSVPREIRMVELDRLVVFQKYINLDYVQQLKTVLGKDPTEEQIFRFCLPADHPHPHVQVMSLQNG